MSYTPLPSQSKFHQSPAQFRAIVGGLGSGKTTCGSREALRLTQTFPGSLGVIGRLTSTALRDTTQRRFFEVIDQVTNGKPDKLVHKWLEGQSHLWLKTPKKGIYSEILFRHLDEPGPLGSLDLDWWWIDECHEPDGGEVPESVFLMLRGRLRGKRGPLRGVITSNSGGKDWIWRWFFSKQKPKGFWGITVPSLENKANLPPNYIRDLMRDNPEDWVNRFINCSFDAFAGQIFGEFSTKDYVIDLQNIPSGIAEAGFDFGVSAPTAVVAAKVAPDGTIYIYDEFYRPEANIKIVASWIKPHKFGLIWADPTTRNRGPNAKSPRDLYLEENVILTPAPSNNALLRISMIHQYLMRRRIFISKGCDVLISTLEDSRWKNVREGERERPEKKEDHARDALAYLLLGHPIGELLNPVVPGDRGPIQIEGGGFRHPSLDEDEDKSELESDILNEEEWMRYVAG